MSLQIDIDGEVMGIKGLINRSKSWYKSGQPFEGFAKRFGERNPESDKAIKSALALPSVSSLSILDDDGTIEKVLEAGLDKPDKYSRQPQTQMSANDKLRMDVAKGATIDHFFGSSSRSKVAQDLRDRRRENQAEEQTTPTGYSR
jgi:hypothetical protein